MDNFEQSRRTQETTSEYRLTQIRLAVVILSLGSVLINEFIPISPISNPPHLAGYLLVALLIGSFVLVYLRRQPPYWPLRKYFFSSLDIVGFLGALILYSTSPRTFPNEILYIPEIGMLSMAIALSGLRYDVRLVVFTGLFAFLAHIAFLVCVPSPLGLAIFVITAIALGGIVLCVAFTVSSLIHLQREATWKNYLARFLAPELVQEIVRKPAILQQQTERRVATVLFTDIRGFTALSEQLPPETVVTFLNLYLEEMSAAIMEHHGMVDKFIGDAIMGVFGVPLVQEAHATLAVQTALSMQARLNRLNVTLAQRHLPTLGIGIGIHTGEVVAAAIGSTQRLDYTVIGDTVNVAARVQALSRKYPVDILLTEATQALLPVTIPLKEVGTTEVRNRAQPVTLWTPLIESV
jgi:class 3 adenylate cyclase